MKHIVIIGGGFAGITCAVELSKAFGNGRDAHITVVDRERYLWFRGDFYEVASSPEEVTDIPGLKNSVTLPLEEILKPRGIHYVHDEVVEVDAQRQRIMLKNTHALEYDYLVSALGSETCFADVLGVKEYALPLKSFTDALRIRNAIEFAIQQRRQDTTKRHLAIVIVGGGISGVELAAALAPMADFLSWKYTYPREKIDICIMEKERALLPALPVRISKDILARLHALGVRVETGIKITEISRDLISSADGQKRAYACVVWTAGVQSVKVPFVQALPKDGSGRILVNDALQVPKYHNIFFIGDQAHIEGVPSRSSAAVAIDQGKFAARQLLKVMLNRKPASYRRRNGAYIIGLGHRFAVYASDRLYTVGYVGYLLGLWRAFMYCKNLVGFVRAYSLVYRRYRLYNRAN